MLGSERATAPSFPRRLAAARSYMPADCRLAGRSGDPSLAEPTWVLVTPRRDCRRSRSTR